MERMAMGGSGRVAAGFPAELGVADAASFYFPGILEAHSRTRCESGARARLPAAAASALRQSRYHPAVVPGPVVLLCSRGREALPACGLDVCGYAWHFCDSEGAVLLCGADVSRFACGFECGVG